MGNEAAPEFVPNQSLYFPANTTTNYYGYCYTGIEQPSEWNDQRRYFGLSAQNLQFSGLQTESLPYVYCPPNYEYAQSPYNPYNPYIPGAVMGIDGPHVGFQRYLNEPSFQRAVSPTTYTPFVVQSSSDMAPYTSPDHFSVGTAGGKYIPPLSSVSAIPLKASLQNQAFEPFQPSHQIPIDLGPMNGSVVNAAPSMHGALTSGITSYMTQGSDHSSHGDVQSGRVPVKVAIPGNNSITNFGPNARGRAPGDRIRPRAQLNGIFSRNLVEQNTGPRMNRSRAQLASPLMSRAYATEEATGNLDGNVIVRADQYNRDDFPVDYKDAKFFVVKSYSEDDVHKSIKYNVWSSTSSGNKKLDHAYGEAHNEKPTKCPVFLFFSVNASGHFCGVAEMIGPVDFLKDMDFWLQDKWTGSFPVRWHIVKDVPNPGFRRIILANNENRPVTSSRDTQEVPYLPGMSMLSIFKNSPMTTSILDDYMYFEERQRITQEEKSRILWGRSNQNSVSLPASTKPDSQINQLTRTEEERTNDTVVQAPASEHKEPNMKEPTPASDGKADHTVDTKEPNMKEPMPASDEKADNTVDTKEPCMKEPSPATNGKADHTVKEQSNDTVVQDPASERKEPNMKQPTPASDGKADHTVDQGSKVEENQQNVACCKPLTHKNQLESIPSCQPSRTNDDLLNNGKPPNGIQSNGEVDQHRETSGKRINRSVDCNDPRKSGSSQDEQDAKPECAGDSRDASETDETDVTELLTVGSMQIKITKSNSSFTGTAIIGSAAPVVDLKQLKI